MGVGRVALAGGESSVNVGGTAAWLWEVSGDAAADAFPREATVRGPEGARSNPVRASIAV
jgi:hypothetical protein